jgi:hypothetical protein
MALIFVFSLIFALFLFVFALALFPSYDPYCQQALGQSQSLLSLSILKQALSAFSP